MSTYCSINKHVNTLFVASFSACAILICSIFISFLFAPISIQAEPLSEEAPFRPFNKRANSIEGLWQWTIDENNKDLKLSQSAFGMFILYEEANIISGMSILETPLSTTAKDAKLKSLLTTGKITGSISVNEHGTEIISFEVQSGDSKTSSTGYLSNNKQVISGDSTTVFVNKETGSKTSITYHWFAQRM